VPSSRPGGTPAPGTSPLRRRVRAGLVTTAANQRDSARSSASAGSRSTRTAAPTGTPWAAKALEALVRSKDAGEAKAPSDPEA
jgi:hypothetical protein